MPDRKLKICFEVETSVVMAALASGRPAMNFEIGMDVLMAALLEDRTVLTKKERQCQSRS